MGNSLPAGLSSGEMAQTDLRGVTPGRGPAAEFAGTARFAVRRRLGSGGMGVVYEAWDRERNEAVALKTLRDLDAAALYRLKREFRALADVAHPNLVGLHELLVEGERWFFTMELVAGQDFLSSVRPGWSVASAASATESPTGPANAGRSTAPPVRVAAGTLDEPRLRSALRQLCEAVGALHQAGRLHRDLKPSNVLVQADGRVVVLDFGLALELQPERGDRSEEHGIAGTPAYMAPEQAAMEAIGPPADWYAVGAMIYEALTGRPPFEGSPLQILMDKQREEPVAPERLAPDAPADICSLCAELLRRLPEKRPAAAEVLRRLGAEPAAPAAAPPSPSAGGPLPLVGQERVLAGLREAFGEVQKGNAATVLLLGGAGVGTSAVARRFAELVQNEADAVVLAGRCYERESVPFKALDSLIDALSRHLRRLPRLEAEALLPRDVHSLARMFPVLRRIEAVAGAPHRSVEAADPQELRNRATSALRELLSRIADRRPLIVMIDGLQWSDADSGALLTELLRAPDAPCMLLVACYRRSLEDQVDPRATPVPRSAEATSPPLSQLQAQLAAVCAVREIEVQPLSPAEARELALLLLSSADLPGNLAEMVALESCGSPFLVHELVRALQLDASGKGLSAGITLAQAIQARLEVLPEPARRLLEVVAVSGGPTPPAIAGPAAGLEGDTRATFSLLRAAHLLSTSADGERVEAYHDRIRETVVSAMDAERLREVHMRLAVALELAPGLPDAAALAFHFRAAGRSERAADYAALAADRAAEALAFERAARLYNLALSLRAPDARWGSDLEIRLADALASAGLGTQSARAYLDAAGRAWATRAEAIELRRRAAEQYLRVGHIDEGLELLGPVLANYGLRIAATPRRALLSLLLLRAQVKLRGTRFDARDPSQVSAEELARIDVCWTAAQGLAMVDTIRGASFHARHLLLALNAGEPIRIARAFAAEAPFVATSGSPRAQREAQRLVGQAGALAERLDQPRITAWAGFTAAVVDFLCGRWRSCRDRADQAAALFRERCTNVAWELSNCHLFSLWSLYYLGDLGELGRRVEALRHEAISRGDLYAATSFRTGLTNVSLLVADDAEGARREVAEVLAQWSHQGFHFQHYWGLLAQGVADLYAGDGAAAHARIERMWPELQRSLMLRIQNVRVEGTHLRARSALAALDGSSADAQRLAAVEAAARELSRVPLGWSRALATLLEAGLRLARRDEEGAAARFESAGAQLLELDMALFAAAAQRRVGELRGGSEGAAQVAAVDARMSAQGIVNPRRMTALLTPGG